LDRARPPLFRFNHGVATIAFGGEGWRPSFRDVSESLTIKEVRQFRAVDSTLFPKR